MTVHWPSKEIMILMYKITVQEISKNGKNHKWPKYYCDKCKRNMWGHGFVKRYFSATPEFIFLKRHRCPECGQVVTTRPEGHLPSIQTSLLTIYQTLKNKISSGHWPTGFPRQRGGHWLKKIVLKAKMSCEQNLLIFLENCYRKKDSFFT